MRLTDLIVLVIAFIVLWHCNSCATRNVGSVDEPQVSQAADSVAADVKDTAAGVV